MARADPGPIGADAMIWFSWRQFRTQTWFTVAALTARVYFSSPALASRTCNADVAACQSDCTTAIENFVGAKSRGSGTVFDLVSVAYVDGARLIGMFWGAPLIARELETGTHRLAWNQSVTRTRWLVTKLA